MQKSIEAFSLPVPNNSPRNPHSPSLRNKSERHVAKDGIPTFNTALVVVPPEELWDTIQRARHLARDTTYRRWPPAIRLFHPFCPRTDLEDTALDVAKVVEKYDIKPFRVTLNTFAIVPNLESIEADLEALKSLPTQQQIEQTASRGQSERDVEAMIEREARVGKERRKRRKKEGPSKSVDKGEAPPDEGASRGKPSPKTLLENQQKMYDEFNGPCVVCLEPDRRSRDQLEEIRDILKEELLSNYDSFSPCSSISVTGSLPKTGDLTFRPLLPIGGFSSVTSAIRFTKHLKTVWRPLSFKVSDLQFISDLWKDETNNDSTESAESFLAKMSVKDPTGEKDFEISNQFGCDASVMLMGEEIEQDDGTNKLMMDIVLRNGIPGAADTTQNGNENGGALWSVDDVPPEDEFGEEGAALLAWLDEDEAEGDAGTVVVLGRTHFFSGEMREYDGMPAPSAVDGKDRVMGRGVSASARRKAVSKSSWEDGDFGERGLF